MSPKPGRSAPSKDRGQGAAPPPSDADRKPRSFDEKRARIQALGASSIDDGRRTAELRQLLADKSGFLAGDAAELAKQRDLRALIPDLVAAFERHTEDGLKTDKGCFGKSRILEALLAFDAQEAPTYRLGLRYFQLEPAFGEPIDAAAGLRGLCCHALFHVNDPKALVDVAPLLFDPEAVTRAEAAAALGSSGSDAAGAVLHLKVLTGDHEPDVMGACYKGLLRLDPPRYLPLIREPLGLVPPKRKRSTDPESIQLDEDSRVEAAALALGEARPAGALELLTRAARAHSGARTQNALCLAIALLRSDEATRHLVAQIEQGITTDAIAALSALALHRHDEKIRSQVETAMRSRGERAPQALKAVFDEKFLGARR